MVEIYKVCFLRLDDERGEARNLQVIGEFSALALNIMPVSTANGHFCGESMQRDQRLTSFASCSPTPTPLHSQVRGGPLQLRNPYLNQSKTNKLPEHQVPSSDSQHFTSRSGNSHA